MRTLIIIIILLARAAYYKYNRLYMNRFLEVLLKPAFWWNTLVLLISSNTLEIKKKNFGMRFYLEIVCRHIIITCSTVCL